MIRLVVYNGHQKDMYCNDIRLHVQDVDIILFKWYMIRLVVYNGRQKDIYCNHIRLHVQDVDIILDLKVNTNDMTYVIILFTLTSSNICISTPIVNS